MVAGCSSGDDGTSADGGPFTIVTDIDFTTETGTFRVKKGSEELGCSSGTFVDHALGQAGESSGAILKVLTTAPEPKSQKELAQLLGMNRHSLAHHLDSLEAIGLVGKERAGRMTLYHAAQR